jgi:DNA-binding transcriptional ArsR family regulator
MTANMTSASDQDLEQLTSLFRLLSDKTRLNILLILAEGERNVSSLCDELKLPQPTVSHHLGLLRVNNVIANRRNGKQVYYALNGRVNLDGRSGLEVTAERYGVKIGRRETTASTESASSVSSN